MYVFILKILFVVLCFQFIFVSVFLFQTKNGKSISNKLLAIVFLMISISVINLGLMAFQVDVKFSELLLIDDTFMLAYGPLLYVFAQSVIIKDFSFNKWHLLHFVPFLMAMGVFVLVVFFVDPASVQAFTSQIQSQSMPVFVRLGEFLILTHIFVYLIRSKLAVRKVITVAYDRYSSMENTNHRALQFILNSFIILFALSLLHSVLPFAGYRNGLFLTLLLMVLTMFYFINSVLLGMLKKSTTNSGLIEQADFEVKRKYSGSALTKTELESYKSKLWSYINTDKKYLNSELQIDELAKELEIPSKLLSQVINEGYGCSFFDFINQLRIEEAKYLLLNKTDSNMTIQEVMYESGFNSKSSFNTAFKKFTQQTPTQFKNSV